MIEKFRNFRNWVIYQIYPRSFLDTNGDGIGDLNGVTAKLDYLKDLGVDAIWLCPCYKSPNVDNGYDIADYRQIMDEFGTIEDAKRLIAEIKKRDMKLIMDLVPNHTSDQHRWFIESRKSKDNPYSDFYYWFDEPINDWRATFGGSAWQYDEMRGQYYLHSYAVQQPDLNWDNPKVVKEMQDVVDFWIDLGVDGFRCDVIDQISKDFEGDNNCFGPNLHKYIHALFGREKAAHLFTVGECWAGDIEEICRHTKAERGELSTLFQFDHLNETGRYEGNNRNCKWNEKPGELRTARDILTKWQLLNQEHDILHTLFTDNHDNNYFLSRAANDTDLRYESATCIATMIYLMNGVPLIYQGQEIGCCGSHYDSLDDFDDIESINLYHELIDAGNSHVEAMKILNFGGRDNARRPMPWTAGENGGFTTGKPWITMASRCKEINLETDLASEKSVFRFYKELFALRKCEEVLRQGTFTPLHKAEDNFAAYLRELDGRRICVVCNFDETNKIEIPEAHGEILLSNYGRTQGDERAFRPYEIAVYRMQ